MFTCICFVLAVVRPLAAGAYGPGVYSPLGNEEAEGTSKEEVRDKIYLKGMLPMTPFSN
jgi:hypothetical protein